MRYVYLLKSVDCYKVGVATNVKKRVYNIQTSNPNPVDIVAANLVEDAYSVEGSIHTYLQSKKMNGGKEWFKLSAEEALEVATIISNKPTLDLTKNLTIQSIVAEQTKRHKVIEQKLDAVLEKASILVRVPEVENVPPKKVKQGKTDDVLVEEAIDIVKTKRIASASLLQRHLRVGYARAARIIDQLEQAGIVSSYDGARAREVLV